MQIHKLANDSIKVFSFLVLVIIGTFLTTNAQADTEETFYLKLANAAEERTQHQVRYDSRYFKIDYPGGDVPSHLGVCTDVVIRSYRALGIDLQQLVHEDMAKNFRFYPKMWNLSKPDSNIDHRRVPNLQVFFARYGESLPISENADDYRPGDIVTWNIATPWRKIVKRKNNIPHIGIVTNKMSKDNKRPLIAHNIGMGPRMEDMLFDFEITGVYRYKA